MTSSKTRQPGLEGKLVAVPDDPEWDSHSSSGEEEDEEDVDELKNDKKALIQKAAQKSKSSSSTTTTTNKPSSVIYLGHLPVGFEEGELRGFLSQFGPIARMRFARSRKFSNPKGYAFIEFEDAEVAAIVAETLGGYLLLEKRLVCHVVPSDQVSSKMFRKHQPIDWQQKHAEKVNAPKSKDKLVKITQRLVSREQKKRQQLKDLGIDYDFPGYEASSVKGSKTSNKQMENQMTDKAKDGPSKRKRKDSNASNDERSEKGSSKDATPESLAEKKKRKKKKHQKEALHEQELKVDKKKPLEPKRKRTDSKDESESLLKPSNESEAKTLQLDTPKSERKKKKKKKTDKKRRKTMP